MPKLVFLVKVVTLGMPQYKRHKFRRIFQKDETDPKKQAWLKYPLIIVIDCFSNCQACVKNETKYF